MTVLTQCQVKEFSKEFKKEGEVYRIIATVRFDDRCNNGHNTLYVTGDVSHKQASGRWVPLYGGCIHEEIGKHFPELREAIRFHLCSTDGPLHYVPNTCYWAKKGNLEYARKSSIWPTMTQNAMGSATLARKLERRLPKLMTEFQGIVENLGFTY